MRAVRQWAEQQRAKRYEHGERAERYVPTSLPTAALPHCRTTPHCSRVIPSFVLVGPLAIIAALFPGVFARMAVGMKRWRAFLTVASINSTLALAYWAVFVTLLPAVGGVGGPVAGAARAVTTYLTAVSVFSGWCGPGTRYRRMAAERPGRDPPCPAATELLRARSG